MAKGKYNRDYRLIEEFPEKGRVRTGYEYIGDPWFLCSEEKVFQSDMKKALLFVIIAAAAFIIPLIPYTGMMHKLWIALPYVFTLLPLFMTGDLVVTMRSIKNPMEHRFADKLNNGYPPRTLAMCYLSGVALVSEIVYLVMNGLSITGDILMAICTAVLFICGVMLFKMRGSFRAEVRNN